MKAVDFYKLPREIQDRFVGSVMGGFPPTPLLVARAATPAKIMWLGVSAACLIVLIVVARFGYGSLDSGLSLHSSRALVLYGALAFGLAFGLVNAATIFVRERALPFAQGVYLFPACLIDARSDAFKVHDTQDLTQAELHGGSVRVTFSGGASFVFPGPDAARAGGIVAEVHAARDRALHAKATEDPKDLVAVDPLHNPRFSSPVGPRESYDVRLPPWKRLGWLVALAIAAVLAPTLWALRNRGSDTLMYAHATQTNDTKSYKAYLQLGKKYKDEVATILLPRAELRDAESAGTVDALLRYKADHPDSKIAPELAISIRTAMLAELEKAKARGSLAALEEFGNRYPGHGIEPELREAIHAVYMRELDAYKKRAPGKDKGAVPFVERLFDWAEKHGPRIEVRLRRKKSESLTRADQHVARSPSFAGEVSYPTHYFDDKHAQKREKAFAQALATKIEAGLSPELFDVGVGATVGEADAVPEVKVPTLFVAHAAEWTGHSYTTTKPRGVYVAILFPFAAEFVLPADAKPFKLKADVMKPAPIGILKEEDLSTGAAEERVYEAMTSDAFESFGTRLLGIFFPKDK